MKNAILDYVARNTTIPGKYEIVISFSNGYRQAVSFELGDSPQVIIQKLMGFAAKLEERVTIKTPSNQ